MRRVLLLILLLSVFIVPVSAEELTAPPVPEAGAEWMPDTGQSFTEGLLEILSKVMRKVQPGIMECLQTCLRLVAVVLMVCVVRQFPDTMGFAVELAGTAVIGLLLIRSSQSLIRLAAESVSEISDYGKLLLPVMTSAMAAGGSVTASGGLYLGTVFFDSVLSSAVSLILVPMIYGYLAVSLANRALSDDMLKHIQSVIKSAITWLLKTILYIFTGYITITGVVSGTTDAAALKAAKITISGMVPVVGGILSDASEAVLVGADIVKNAVGVYGLLAIISLWVGPFLQIGLHYLCLKLTSLVCGIFGTKATSGLIADFTTAMGFLLAMTGTVCLMLVISTVCFMKGVG